MNDQDRWRQVDSLFQRVLDLEGPERQALLEEACHGDPELREEIESLLRFDEQSHHFLDQPVWSSGFDEPAPISLPAMFGDYELLQLLGEGGMGQVYLAARRDGVYDRQVAIKILKGTALNPEALGRFRNEWRILAKLEHEGIARLYEVGKTPAGLPYLVMEYVDGVRLDQYLPDPTRSAKSQLDERLRVFRDICDAVTHAHRFLVVHRDLKPSNILMTSSGKPKLLDFGIAKALSSDVIGAASEWTVGQQPLTPNYASPEQLSGAEITTSTDVYALGLLLTELVLGTTPGGNLEKKARSPEQLLARADSSMPEDLRAIALAATAERPEDRYPSAGQLSDEIGRFRSGLPVHARAPTKIYRMRRFVRRHRPGVAAGISFLLISVLSAIGFALLARRLSVETSRAHIESQTSRQVTDFLVELFAQAEPPFTDGSEPTASQMLERGLANLESESSTNLDSTVLAALLRAIGRAYFELSRLDDAANLAEKSLALTDRHAASSDGASSAKGEALLVLAEVEVERSNLDRAVSLARDALASLEQRGATPELVARAHRILGIALQRHGDHSEAMPYLEAALEADLALFGTHSHQAGASYAALARLASERRDLPTAEVFGRSALEAFQASLGPEHPRSLTALADLSITLQNQGKLRDAEATYLDLLDRQRRVFGELHAVPAATLNTLGTTNYELGDFDAAEARFRESLAIHGQLSAEPTLDYARILTNLARTLRERDGVDEAIPLLRQALEISRLNLAPNSPSLGQPLLFLGGGLCTDGDRREGEQLLDEARSIYVATFGADHYRVALVDATRARCLVRAGFRDDARDLFETVLPRIEAHFGLEHRTVEKVRQQISELSPPKK